MIESHSMTQSTTDFSRDMKRSAADVKKIETHAEQLTPSSNACPEMYILSKDNKLCYSLAKIRVRGTYSVGFRRVHSVIDALLVNKSEAVQFCKFHSNGTLPYGKLKNPLFFTLLLFKDRSQLKILQSENIAPVRAWFGASLNYEARAFLSDYDGSLIVPDDNIINTPYLMTFITAGKEIGKRNYFSLYGNRDENKSKRKTKFLGLMIFYQTVSYHTRESLTVASFFVFKKTRGCFRDFGH